MSRQSSSQYDNRVMAASGVYAVLLLALLPSARSAQNLAIQLLCTLLPLVPMFYVIWLMARRIRQSDELKERTHLIGLGVASAIVGTFGLVGGFLAITKILPPDVTAIILVWIFPILLLGYSGGRWWALRSYGIDGLCETSVGMPLYLRFLGIAAIFGVIAVWAHLHAADDFRLGLLDGMVGAIGAAGLGFGLRRWWRRRRGRTPT